MARSPLDKNPRRRRNGLRAVSPRPQSNSPSRPRRKGPGAGRILSLLGLGALGLVAAALIRRPSSPAPRRLPDDEGRRSLGPGPSQGPTFEPREDDTISWIAGPTGNLRFLERHSGGQVSLVFLHGLGGCLEHWLPLLDKTGPALHSVALDLPGHGASELERGEDGATVAAMAKSVVAVLDHLRLRRVVLVGHDLGAAVAIQTAALASSRVRGLFLVDPNGDQSRISDANKQQVIAAMEVDPREEVRWQFQQILMDAGPRVADRVLADLGQSQQEALLGAVRSCLDFAPIEVLEKLSIPCKSLVSDLNDLPYSLHNLMPELPSAVLTEASHWLMMDAPQGVWEALVDFLDRVDLDAAT